MQLYRANASMVLQTCVPQFMLLVPKTVHVLLNFEQGPKQ